MAIDIFNRYENKYVLNEKKGNTRKSRYMINRKTGGIWRGQILAATLAFSLRSCITLVVERINEAEFQNIDD